jgi:hypothetical protein
MHLVACPSVAQGYCLLDLLAVLCYSFHPKPTYTHTQAGEDVVFTTVEDFEAVPADDDEVDVMFIVMANGGFTINSVGFADPGLRLQ